MDPGVSGNPLYRNEIQVGLQALPTMSITMDEAALFGPEAIYKNPFKAGRELERQASIEYFDPKTREGFRLNAALRIHGDDSQGHPKKPFSLNFRREYGSGKLHFPLFPNFTMRKINKLVLRSGGHDAWTGPLGYGFSQAISAIHSWSHLWGGPPGLPVAGVSDPARSRSLREPAGQRPAPQGQHENCWADSARHSTSVAVGSFRGARFTSGAG